jgi:hypothetical protein
MSQRFIVLTNDVPSADRNAWYFKFLGKAYNYKNPSFNDEKIAFWGANGPSGSDHWAQPVTRDEAAHMLFNAMQLANPSTEYKEAARISDVPPSSSNSPWIYGCKKFGYMIAFQDGSFKPERVLNRAEAVQLIYKTFYEALLDHTDSTPDCPDIYGEWARYFETNPTCKVFFEKIEF